MTDYPGQLSDEEEAFIRQLIEKAPPLSAMQVAQLRMLFVVAEALADDEKKTS